MINQSEAITQATGNRAGWEGGEWGSLRTLDFAPIIDASKFFSFFLFFSFSLFSFLRRNVGFHCDHGDDITKKIRRKSGILLCMKVI